MFEFDIQRFGGGGTTVVNETAKVPDITPEERELQGLTLEYAKNYAFPSAKKLNTLATDSLTKTLEPDFGSMYYGQTAPKINAITSQHQGLTQGILPEAFKANKQQYIKSGVEELGSALSGAAGKGVVNSSLMDRARSDVQTKTSEALGKQFNEDIQLNQDLLDQGLDMAYAPIQYATQAQVASQAVPASWYQMSLGQSSNVSDAWNNMANRRYSLRSNPQAVQQQSSGWAGGLGSIAGALIGCVDGDTPVLIDGGVTPIKHVEPGQMILGHGKMTEIEAVIYSIKPCIEIVTDEGNLIVTESQPILIAEDTLVDAGDLEVGQQIFDKNILVIADAGRRTVYELKVKDTYFNANGFILEGYTDEEYAKLLGGE